jgi:hypothetical protein
MSLKQYFALFLAIGILLSACKKSEPGNSNIPAKKKKYLTQMIQVSGGNTTFTKYTYDSQKRLASVKQGNTVIEYSYYNNNQISTIDYRSRSGTDNYETVTQYTYSVDDKLTQFISTQTTNGVYQIDHLTGVVFKDNKITELHFDDATQEILTYNANGDVSKKQFYQSDVTYTYSDKKNVLTPDILIKPEDYVSTHLKLSEISTSQYSVDTTTYAYTFNANGNMVQMDTKGSYYILKTIYAYDSDGYMTGLSSGSDDMPAQKYNVAYVYGEL